MLFTRVFRPETKLYSRMGEHKQYFVGTGPEMHTNGTEPVIFFWGTIFAKGTHFSLAGVAQTVIWGARPRNAPRGAGPAFLPSQKRLFR